MNYVSLIGRITKDPEIKTTDSGRKYVRFSLAVSRYNNTTDFITCVAWEKRAELLANYVRKGNRICIQGSISVRQYKVNEENRTITEVLVDNIEFLESKGLSENTQEMSTPNIQPDIDESDDDGNFPF